MFQEKLSKIETYSLESHGAKMERNALEEYMDKRQQMEVPQVPQAPIRTFLAGKALPSSFEGSPPNGTDGPTKG